jgi:hypothetical protein
MHDVIAIKVKDKRKGKGAFLTWGRVFDRLDTSEIENKIILAAKRFGFHHIESISVCESLQSVAHYPYFYEALLTISWKPIPFGRGYKIWAKKKKREMLAGKEIYFLGRNDGNQ